MSRPPLAPRITDTLYDMYEDAKKVNDVTNEAELERKLAIISAVNDNIKRRLEEVGRTSRPDPFMQRKLRAALEENVTIRDSVENSLSAVRGSAGDRLGLSRRLDEQAQIIANLEAELARRTREKEDEINQLNSDLANARDSLRNMRGNIEEKENQLENLRRLQSQVGGESSRLNTRIQELEEKLEEEKAKYNRMLQDRNTRIVEKAREIERLESKKQECEMNSERLVEQIANLEARLQRLQEDLAANPPPAAQQGVPPELQQLREELSQCRRETNNITAQKERVELEKQRLEEELAESQRALRAQRDEAKAAETRASDIDRSLQNAQGRLQDCERKEADLIRAAQNLSAQLADKARGNSALEQEVNRLQLNLTGNLDTLELLREKERELKEERKSREEEKQQHQEERQRLENDIQQKEQERQRLEDDIQRKDQERQRLEDSNQSNEQERQRLEDAIQQREQERRRLEDAIQQKEQERQRLEDNIQQKEQERQAERQRLEDAIQQKEQEKQQALDRIRDMSDSLNADQRETAQRLQEQDQKLNEVKEQAQGLRDRVADLEAERQQLQEERPIANARIAELENKVQELSREKDVISEQVRQKEAETNRAVDQLQDVQQRLEQKEQDNDRKQAVIQQLQNENDLKQSEVQRISGELDRLREQARLAGESGDTLSARLTAAQEELTNLEREKRELEANLLTERAEKAERETQLRAAQEELQNVSRQLADLGAREQELQQEKGRLDAKAALEERLKGQIGEEHKQKEREWEEKKAQLDTENQELGQRVRDLVSEQKTAEIEKGNLEAKIARLEGEVATGRQELEQLRDSSSRSVGEQASALNNQIREKEDALQNLNQKLEQKENEIAAAREQAVRDLAAKDNVIAQKTAELESECNQRLQVINDALEEQRQEKENASREFDRAKVELEQKVNNLERQIERLTNEKEAETRSLQTAIATLEEKLRLSEEEKNALQQRVEEYRRLGGTVEEVKQKLEDQERQINQAQERLADMRRDAEQAVAVVRDELDSNRKTIADLEQKLQREVDEEKNRGIRERQQLQAEHDELKRNKEDLDLQLEVASGVQNKLRQQAEQYQKRIAELEDEKNELVRRFNEEIQRRCPSALGDLTDLLLRGLQNVLVIDVTDEEIDKLSSNMTKAIQLYTGLVGRVYDITVDRASFGNRCLHQYILPCVYMFHAWKCMLRIPIVLRAGIPLPDRSYFYPVPKDEEEKKSYPEEELMKMISSRKIEDSYRSKIQQDGTMRIDILMYYVVVGMLKKMDAYPESIAPNAERCSNRDEEFRSIILYVIELLKHANRELVVLDQKIGNLIGTLEFSVRITHNSNNPVLTFLRLSSKTPDQPNVRFDYRIDTNDKVFHVKYSGQDDKFYEQTQVGKDYVRNSVEVTYDSDYHFGPFTHIFKDRETNDVIVDNPVFQKEIEDRLRDGKPVCIIGYGASGSGKTTTLVYADYYTVENGRRTRVQLPGILILLAKNLANPKRYGRGVVKPAYDKCLVQIYELEAEQKDGGESGVCRKFPGDEKEIERVVIMTDDTAIRNTVSFTNCDDDRKSLEYANVNGNWQRGGEGLEKELVDYINVKRNIARSPNNPQSSRSHVIAKLIFQANDGRETTLIVCDFAGVENRFNCNDEESLNIMGPELIVKETSQSYINAGKAFWANELSDEKEVYSPLIEIFSNPLYEFKYVASQLLPSDDSKQSEATIGIDGLYPLITRSQDSITTDRFKQMFEVCKVLSGELLRTSVPNILPTDKAIREIVKGWTDADIRDGKTVVIDISKINVKWTEIKFGAKGLNDQFTPNLAFGPIWNLVTSLPGYIPLRTLYVSITGEKPATIPSTSPNIPFLIRLVWWFLTSWQDSRDIKRIPLPDLLVQSYLSYMLGGSDDKLLTEKAIKTSMRKLICQTRVHEGVYINKSLSELRKFIADTVQSTREQGSVSPFIDMCAPLQCNPYYRDCFGQVDYYDQFQKPFELKSPSAYGLLSKYIMKVNNSAQMTFCIINVLNLSRDANNPPKSPYIDITELQIEYEKLLAYLESSKAEQERLLGMSGGLTPTLREVITKLVVDLSRISAASGIKPAIEEYAQQLLKGYDLRSNLTRIIDVITNFNAITPIGTLEFTDMMAKFAINRVTCNLTPTLPRGPVRDQPALAPPVRGRSPAAARPPASPSAAARPSAGGSRIAAQVDQANIIPGSESRRIMRPRP